MDDETAPSVPVEAPEAPEAPQTGGTGGNGPSTWFTWREQIAKEREGKPFPWEALHKALTRRLGELVDQAAHLDILHELKVLDRVHSDFHVDLDD